MAVENPNRPPEYDIHEGLRVFVGASAGGGAIVVRTSLQPSER